MQKSKGFTLIELIVVLAVFIIVISIAVSIFISIVEHQRGILSEQELLNQISYVMEYMTRGIRSAVKDTAGSCLSGSGYFYSLTHYDSTSGFYDGIKFLSEDNVCEEFFLDTDGLLKEIKNGGSAQNIVSSKFVINYVRFIINGDKTLNAAFDSNEIHEGSMQPRVTIAINVKKIAVTKNNFSPFSEVFQTTVSQINLNIK